MKRLLACVLAVAAIAAPVFGAPLKLERVVMLQRHGIRPPTVGNDQLARFAAEPWPAWPVPSGDLTPHGGEVVRLLRDLARSRGVPILLVTHDPRILDIADRIVAMEDGRILPTTRAAAAGDA